MHPTALALSTLVLAVVCSVAATPEPFVVAAPNIAPAVIVNDPPPGGLPPVAAGIGRACALLQRAVERATGQRLAIKAAGESLPANTRKILVGGGVATRAAGFDMGGLPEEGYRVVARADALALFGNLSDKPGKLFAPTPYFAAAEVVDRHWGGLWLWPGEGGFFIPKAESLTVPAGAASYQPRFPLRRYSLGGGRFRPGDKGAAASEARLAAAAIQDAEEWMGFQRMGSRWHGGISHAFNAWWDRYSASHPDYFAQLPPSYKQPYPAPDRVKLRLGNPKIDDVILAEWRAEGKPDMWSVAETDGAGFCVAPETRAMDEPPGQDPESIVRAQANLSARYAKWWKRLLEKFRAEDPNVRLVSLIYSAMRYAPPRGLRLPPGMLLGYVGSYDDAGREIWQAWRDAGADLWMRTNWFYVGLGAPHILPHAYGEFVRWAAERGLAGLYFDKVTGNWATQGLDWYVVARLIQDPSRPVDDVLAEYARGFGPARDDVLLYARYWEDYSKKCAFPTLVGGVHSVDPEGLYEKAAREHGFPVSPLAGSYACMPHLYGDKVLSPAREILARAKASSADDSDAAAKVRFLSLGLDHLVLLRDAIALGQEREKNPVPSVRKRFEAKVAELRAFQLANTASHVVWGPIARLTEIQRSSPSAVGEGRRPHREEDDLGR